MRFHSKSTDINTGNNDKMTHKKENCIITRQLSNKSCQHTKQQLLRSSASLKKQIHITAKRTAAYRTFPKSTQFIIIGSIDSDFQST